MSEQSDLIEMVDSIIPPGKILGHAIYINGHFFRFIDIEDGGDAHDANTQ